jgi:hypothetical protein
MCIKSILEIAARLQLPVRQIDASRSIEATPTSGAQAFVELAAERGLRIAARF